MRPRHLLSITCAWLIVVAAITPAAAWAEFAVEEATIEQIHAAYLSGKTTAHEVTATYLARIEAYDQLKATGKLSGPLHGIPFVAKDNIDTGDLPTSGGSASLADFQPQRDGTSIERIRKAGGILIAKASLAEFANGGFDSINSRSPGYVRNRG
eukprot:gene46463-biopygen32217